MGPGGGSGAAPGGTGAAGSSASGGSGGVAGSPGSATNGKPPRTDAAPAPGKTPPTGRVPSPNTAAGPLAPEPSAASRPSGPSQILYYPHGRQELTGNVWTWVPNDAAASAPAGDSTASAARAAADAAEAGLLVRKAAGRDKTMLTSSAGVLGDAPVSRTSLLGA